MLPPSVLGPLARSPLRRVAGVALRPPVALAIWAGTMYAWHVPALYDAAVASPALHAFEHASFLTAGLLVWTVILDPARSAGRRAAFAAAVLVAGHAARRGADRGRRRSTRTTPRSTTGRSA